MPELRSNRLRKAVFGLLLASCAPPAFAQGEPNQARLDWGFDLALVTSSGHPSWLEGSGGKLRFDADHDGIVFSRAFLDYEQQLASTVKAHVLAEVYDDRHGPFVYLTEVYLDWRPMTTTATRYRLKVGAFYPRISLENVGPGWASPYSISPSAITQARRTDRPCSCSSATSCSREM